MNPDCIIEQVNYPTCVSHYRQIVPDGFSLPMAYDSRTVAVFKVKLKRKDYDARIYPTLYRMSD